MSKVFNNEKCCKSLTTDKRHKLAEEETMANDGKPNLMYTCKYVLILIDFFLKALKQWNTG